MNDTEYLYDLIVLTADKNMQTALEGLFQREKSLQIRPISVKFYRHPQKDPGCLNNADLFLKLHLGNARHALVIFDYEGCGAERGNTRNSIEKMVVNTLSRSGWGDRVAAIVIEPELENWVFSDSPVVDEVFGWADQQPDLRTWLQLKGFLEPTQIKPDRPKEAIEAALAHIKIPRSSSHYGELAHRVSLGRCTDPAFLKLKTTLQAWFPVSSPEHTAARKVTPGKKKNRN